MKEVTLSHTERRAYNEEMEYAEEIQNLWMLMSTRENISTAWTSVTGETPERMRAHKRRSDRVVDTSRKNRRGSGKRKLRLNEPKDDTCQYRQPAKGNNRVNYPIRVIHDCKPLIRNLTLGSKTR